MSKPTFIQIVKSVLAAFVGVQSDNNRQQDFAQGKLSTYVIAGIIFTLVFVGGLILLVSAILS